ncbi:MAG: DUF3373 family protein [Acidobacteria bacterium]|nr:MAG: DUF3373 family protein [Acidobacteriota bacterium]
MSERRVFSIVAASIVLLAAGVPAATTHAATAAKTAPATTEQRTGTAAAADKDGDVSADATRDAVEDLEQRIEDLERRLNEPERHAALDRLLFQGDFRFEAHTIQAKIPDHFDGMVLQNLIVKTLFYFQQVGAPPESIADLDAQIESHYADWLLFTSKLTFGQLKEAMAGFDPALQQQLFAMYLPAAFVPGANADNDILYTNRLRLRIRARVGDNVTFDGRLSMYKVWGDSTGVRVFNGQPTTINIDGTTANVPNSDILRVERAYFSWNDIGGLPVYLSIGRRPSTGGVPLNFRHDEPRGGTPAGSVIDFQFDGLTFGWHINDFSTLRLCYGVGYESGFGNGQVLKNPADRLDDVQLLGINWDVWDTDDMFVQLTVAKAFDVTDGFNGLVVLPADPVTGQAIPAPVILRYTPSAHLGDLDLASVVFQRSDGPVDWFVSANYVESSPNGVTTPFGGLFSDPFEAPQDRSGSMFYGGVRLRFNDDRTKIGVEYNHGSRYWFNFAAAEDEIIAPKTQTRGDVWEVYLTHRIENRFLVKLDYIDYSYDYSGSGWLLGTPKDLETQPVLGFPTYDSARKFALSLMARW